MNRRTGKNIFTLLLAALAVLSVSSCHKFLDVLPTDAVSDQQAITDSASATNAVRGAYRALAAGGYYGATYQFDALMSGDALNYTQSGASQLQFLYHTLTADNNDLETIWPAAYAAINDANFVLAKVPGDRRSRHSARPTVTSCWEKPILYVRLRISTWAVRLAVSSYSSRLLRKYPISSARPGAHRLRLTRRY